ncbi:MAG: hypothetical protein ACP5NW_00980 [Candidatus Woesearchaeota archaeon]
MIHYITVKDIVSLPSPIYGGDLYYQLGQTNNVKYGGNPLESSNTKGSLPIYFVTYSLITGKIAKLFNIDAFTAELLFSYIILALAIIVIYVFLTKIFDNELLSVIGVLLFVTVSKIPILKYTEFTQIFIIPLFILTIYYFLEKKDIYRTILLGLIYGFVGLTHSIAFVGASLLLASVFIYYEIILERHNIVHNFNTKHVKYFLKKIYPYMIILVIGVGFALLWWFKPIFIYHGQTSFRYLEWNSQSFERLSTQMVFFWDTIKYTLFNFSTIINAIISTITLTTLALMAIITDDKKETRYIKFIGIMSIALTLHYFITQNIFHTSFVPGHMRHFFLDFAQMLFVILGINYIYQILNKKTNHKYIANIFLCLIIILILIGQIGQFKSKMDDQWFKAGKSPIPIQLAELQKYITQNTDVNDNILTTKEVGFAVNSLTGRKLVVSRRAHNDAFINMDERELDAAIILYGNDTQKRIELIKKYDIKYLYWDYYWIQSEYYFNEQGQVTGWFDPLTLFYSIENEVELKDNNVTYSIYNTWLDPALKGDAFPKLDLIFISPNNYHNETHPWKPDLDKYLEKVWHYQYQNQEIAVLYRIKTD